MISVHEVRRNIPTFPPNNHRTSLGERVALFCYFVAISSVSWTAPEFRLPAVGITFSDFMIVIAALFAITKLIDGSAIPTSEAKLVFFGGCLYCAGLLFTSFAVMDDIATVGDAAKYFLATCLGFTLSCALLMDEKRLRIAIACLVVGAAINGLGAGLELLILHHPLLPSTAVYYGRYTGLSEHPDELGPFCATMFCCALYLFTTGSRFNRPFLGLALFCCLLGVLASSSITAGIVVIVGSLLVVITGRSAMSGVMAVLTCAAITPIIVVLLANYSVGFNSLGERLSAALERRSSYVTLVERQESYSLGFSDIAAHPFVGVGHMEIFLPPHNLVIYSWWHGGILSLFGQLAIIGGLTLSTLQVFRRHRRRALNQRFSLLAVALSIGFILSMLQSMVAPGGYRRTSWVVCWLALAASTLSARYVKKPTKSLYPLRHDIATKH